MMRKQQTPMTAKERRDYHFAEMKRAITEMHPDLTKWDVDFTDDRRIGEPLVLGVVIHAGRVETDAMRKASADNWAEYAETARQRKAAEAAYHDSVLAKFTKGASLQS